MDAPPPASLVPPPPATAVPHRPTFLQRIAARLICLVIRGVSVTLRYRWDRDLRDIPAAGRPYIFCIWHNRLPLAVSIYRRYAKSAGFSMKMAGLVSASRDGALLSRILELLGVQPVRGSSSRRGAQALLELNSWLERGYDVAITVDGPRGPRYRMKPGVVGLAQVTGCPIVPATYRVSRKWTLKSWDRFQIPVPFSTCYFNFDDPVPVPRDISDAEREALRQDIERKLTALTRD